MSFLFMAEYPYDATVWIDHNLFSHSLVDGQKGCCCFLAPVDSATVNICVQLWA